MIERESENQECSRRTGVTRNCSEDSLLYLGTKKVRTSFRHSTSFPNSRFIEEYSNYNGHGAVGRFKSCPAKIPPRHSYHFGTKMEEYGEDGEDGANELSNSLPKMQDSSDSPEYRGRDRGRAVSLPTSAPLISSKDLTRLQVMYEESKGKKEEGKKGNGTSKGNKGKSVFNRLTKKLTSTNDSNSEMKLNIDAQDTSTDYYRSPSPNASKSQSGSGVVFEIGTPTSRRSNRKLFERRGSALPVENKSKSSRMGQKIKRTFTSGTNGGDNLLQNAIQNKDLDTLEKLLIDDRYLDEINYLVNPGVSLFHQACVFGDYQVVKLLITKGADVGLLTWTKLSPLKIAVMFGHYEVAELLLNSGSDLSDIRDGFQDYYT